MTLETFFDKFDQFADAPDAVAKMRELVLELAVQGKLVSSEPDNETVPSVIKLREESTLLASSLGLRSPKHADEEVTALFDVPSNWRWIALADIGAAQTGTTPKKTDHKAFNGDIPFIKPADIRPEGINYLNESLTRYGAETGSRLAPSGSLLMVCIGTIGKCGIIEQECSFNQQINSLTPVTSVDPRYLLTAARSRSFQDTAWDKSSSTTIAILNKGKWLSIPVPLPPLAEQKRIVAKVDELMALCDRLEAQQQERDTRHAALARASLARFADAPTPANLHHLFHPSYTIPPADLRKSILTLAVQGKLVPQEPKDGDTGVVTMEELVGRKNLKNGLSLSPTPGAADFICLPLSAVDGSNLICSSGKPIAISAERAAPYLIKPGDVFIMRGNGSKERVGIASMARETPPNVLFPDLLIRVPLPTERIDGEFFLLAWNNPLNRSEIERLAQTTSGIWKVNQGHISECGIPLPPLAEQRRIVAKVDQLMALVDELETQLAASRATAQNLLQALVAELTGTTSCLPANS